MQAEWPCARNVCLCFCLHAGGHCSGQVSGHVQFACTIVWMSEFFSWAPQLGAMSDWTCHFQQLSLIASNPWLVNHFAPTECDTKASTFLPSSKNLKLTSLFDLKWNSFPKTISFHLESRKRFQQVFMLFGNLSPRSKASCVKLPHEGIF